jgi:prophage antirepressor-like protein
MESTLKMFQNERFGEKRAVAIDGEPWFVAADVCGALGIGNPRVAIDRLHADDVSKTDTIDKL